MFVWLVVAYVALSIGFTAGWAVRSVCTFEKENQ